MSRWTKHPWFAWTAAATAAVLVAAASLAPLPENSSPMGEAFFAVPYADLGLHFLGYLVISLAVSKALESMEATDDGGVEVALLAVLGFGVTVEVMQTAAAERSFSVLDVLANAAGVSVVYVVGWRGSAEAS